MSKKKIDALSYQEALQELQDIVVYIEQADLPVDEVIQKVKRANELLAFCKAIIETSGKTLDKLTDSN
jgi:exodeoxyribonuclease VII small subunit